MKNKLVETMKQLQELRIELAEFKATAHEVTDEWNYRFLSLDKIYDEIYKENFRKLICWGNFNRNINNYNNDNNGYQFCDWGFEERGNNQKKGNVIKFNLGKYPMDFDIEHGKNQWDINKIDEAFKKLVEARINRDQLIEVLQQPIEDIKNFEEKLEKEIENKEKQLVKFYDKILENKKLKKQPILKSVFQDETVKEIIMEELLGVEIKKE